MTTRRKGSAIHCGPLLCTPSFPASGMRRKGLEFSSFNAKSQVMKGINGDKIILGRIMHKGHQMNDK